ncbi:acetyl-CoA hydrolase/transferase family protein [Antarctobacter sp.]|uniref:acetyl-CoA hydrolase/transferase family protein n=1 Tax=Antarctobacter sp. TaxID=1872577 RepID=UPI003A903163
MTTTLQHSADFDFSTVLQAGDHVMWPQGTGEPTGLSGRLVRSAPDLPPMTLVLGMVTSPTLREIRGDTIDFLCLNGAAETRRAVAASKGRVIPAHVSAIPELIRSRRIPVDVALIRVRPVENSYMFSLGVMVDFVHEMIASARVVIAEIDERLPLTAQDALISADSITHLTIADGPEPSLPDPVPSDNDRALAARVAELIPDRATIQLGVGGLPVAVCAALKDHRDLGLHSGVIPDAAVDLMQSGAITNAHKGIDQGVTVTGGLFGSRRLFDFAHDNDAIALRRATYTHSARVLAQIDRLHTINSAVEMDLSGQINSEIAGTRYVGAVGGQVDYVRGGRLSEGGRSIIAMASATPDLKHSKIVASLRGKPVTTARSDVDLVVTEYGVADLWGLDLHARAKALIAVAHPDFREALERDFAGQA